MPHIAGTRYALGRGAWVVLGLAGLRVAVPLLVLAGVGVPGTPSFEYDGLAGDATGFYAAARELVSAWADVPFVLAAGLVGGAVLVTAWRRRPGQRAWIVVSGAALSSLVACSAIVQMPASGAAVIGWPLVWAVPLVPYRALGSLDQDGAYVVAVGLALASNVVTVVATAYAGVFATGRKAVGVCAAALFAVWPMLTGPLVGEQAWSNGTWAVDAALAAYGEPLSTALVASALAVLLAPGALSVQFALAGGALGLATVTKLTNGVLALLIVLLIVGRHSARQSLPFAAAGACFMPVVLLYWDKGYPAILEEDPDAWPNEAFTIAHFRPAWADSVLFTPSLLLALVPIAVVGAVLLKDRWARRLLCIAVLVNPAIYSFWSATAHHPRFLFASLPPLFVLWAAGAAACLDVVSGARVR
jgi:hypothetical protein